MEKKSELSDPGSKTILIVEDDEELLGLLEIAVKREGFKFLPARSGEQACQKLSLKPDAILLDIMLPGMTNGTGVLEKVRQLPKAPTVIVLTAYGTRPDFMSANQDLNVVQCFLKPLILDHVMAALHRALNTRSKAA